MLAPNPIRGPRIVAGNLGTRALGTPTRGARAGIDRSGRRHAPACIAAFTFGAIIAIGFFGSVELLAAEPAAKTVCVRVDFGDGFEANFTQLEWKKGMSVDEAIATANAHAHGIKFTRIGAGETALITQIGDVKNEGAGRDRRNWLYWLNGKLADVGIGAQTLEPGDVVLWRFERYDYNGESSK